MVEVAFSNGTAMLLLWPTAYSPSGLAPSRVEIVDSRLGSQGGRAIDRQVAHADESTLCFVNDGVRTQSSIGTEIACVRDDGELDSDAFVLGDLGGDFDPVRGLVKRWDGEVGVASVIKSLDFGYEPAVYSIVVPSPSPSASPSTSPTPSVSPSVSPTPSTSPTPSVSPSVSPTPSTSPTPFVSPSVSPTPSTSPTPSPSASPAAAGTGGSGTGTGDSGTGTGGSPNDAAPTPTPAPAVGSPTSG